MKLILGMLLPLVGELVRLSKVPKLGGDLKKRFYQLTRELRELGFTNHELFVLVGCKVSEVSIKRHTTGVEVRDTAERDKIIGLLADFAEGGYDVGDIEEYKRDKKFVDDAHLSFEGCAEFSENLISLKVDASELLNLSEELAKKKLTGKSIRKNIDLNEELVSKGITPKIQEKIRDAIEKHGSPEAILDIVNECASLVEIRSEKRATQVELDAARNALEAAKAERKLVEAETIIYRSYFDIVKLLVVDYHYSHDSLRELHEVAGKYGDPLRVIGALNAYGGVEAVKVKAAAEEERLRTINEQVANRETRLNKVNNLVEQGERKLGEIKANHAASWRLQMVSDLLQNPRRLEAPPRDMAELIHAFLVGVRENSVAHPRGAKYDGIVRTDVAATILRLERFMGESGV